MNYPLPPNYSNSLTVQKLKSSEEIVDIKYQLGKKKEEKTESP